VVGIWQARNLISPVQTGGWQTKRAEARWARTAATRFSRFGVTAASFNPRGQGRLESAEDIDDRAQAGDSRQFPVGRDEGNTRD